MKKLFAIIIAVTMLFSCMVTPASALEPEIPATSHSESIDYVSDIMKIIERLWEIINSFIEEFIGNLIEVGSSRGDVAVYDATFKLDGGNINGDNADVVIKVEFGAPIVAPDNPDKAGYEFLGWAESKEGVVLSANELGAMNTEGKEFVAVWKIDSEREYVVNIYEQDAQTGKYPSYPTKSSAFNDGVAGREVTCIDIAIPDGFALDERLSSKKEDMIIPVERDQILVINFYLKRESYSFKVYEVYDGEDDIPEINAVYRYGQSIPEVKKPVKEGYAFSGWDNLFVTTTESANFVIPETMPNGDIAIKATWAVSNYSVVFTAGEGEFSDGNSIIESEIGYSESINKPNCEPELYGFDFVGWAEAGAKDDPATDDVDEAKIPVTFPVIMGTEDKVYVPIWAPSKVTLTFYDYQDSDKGPEVDKTMYPYGAPNTITIGDAIIFPASPDSESAPTYAMKKSWLEKGYYTFEGWADAEGNIYKEGDVMPDHDLDLFAVYKRVIVKLVPVDKNSTAMIERDGVVESYNDGYEVILDEYGYAQPATSYDEWFVYGLSPQMGLEKDDKEADLTDFVKVQGDGYWKVTFAKGWVFLGTGSIIEVYDGITNELVEKFYIVIMGDLDGSGNIDSNDLGIINSEVVVATSWSIKGHADYVSYMYKAANLQSTDYTVDATDRAVLIGHVTTVGDEIDQRYGVPKT